MSIIALAKRLHFRLAELPEALDRIMADTVSREERSQVLREKVAEVDAMIAQLQKDRELLARLAETPDKPIVDAELQRLGLWVE